jgi:Na+-translocating ferredoxin:NAD+ oxidoreductase RnfG subunit
MKIDIKKIISLIFISALINNAFSQEIKEKTDKIIRSAFGNEVNLTYEKYFIPADLKKEIESAVKQSFFDKSIYLYKIKKNEVSSGYAMLDNVLGKSLPITFLVIFNPEGEIISTDIVKYREPYGGGVANPSWNDQFKGKNSNSSFNGINGISGATISVNSVTKGIHKLALLFSKIKDQL